jgi:Na+:H+ antiporter, NhaA family
MRLQAFLRTEAAGGILLLVAALLALLSANVVPEAYEHAFESAISLGVVVPSFTLRQFVNLGLMSVFFFVVGMEIKRELVLGELSSFGRASLPAIAAFGGMLAPAALFLAFNRDGAARNGWGIPMATDIAFCVGILSLLKGRVPNALIVFVTALAVFDDIGGILVIALFYGHGVRFEWLLAAASLVPVALAMNRAYVTSGLVYALLGMGFWYTLHRSGIHAAIAGVALGLSIPARPREGARELIVPPIQRFLRLLHPLVSFLVMPLFALANSGVPLRALGELGQADPVALGAATGLFVGKQLGIFGLTLLAVRVGVAPLPGGATRAQLYGASVLSGIGFTVALFIAGLAYPEAPALLERAKVGILVGSAISGVGGYAVLRLAPAHEQA